MTRIDISVGAGVGGGTGVSGGGGTGVRFGREGGFVGTGVFVGIGKYLVEVGEAVGVRAGGIKEAEEVGEDMVGASVAFT